MIGNKSAGFKRKYFALPDFILLGLVLCTAGVGFVNLFSSSAEDNLKAVISLSGEVYEEITLSEVQEPYSLTIKGENGEAVVLCVTSDSVEFCHSPCPDKLCVNTGKLTKSGDSAVCLPQRVSVKLMKVDGKQAENQPDAIVG